ncbi:MAG: hypothetical protein FWE33_06755 [Defluviitaleaceae bacterium]|nr:hypothetical protein [Defluviitaleaceae bacterium]
MGMSDLQYKAHIRHLVLELERALKINPDNEVLKELIAMYKEVLQS